MGRETDACDAPGQARDLPKILWSGGLAACGADALHQRVLAVRLGDRFLAAAGLVEQVERFELVVGERAGGEIGIIVAAWIVHHPLEQRLLLAEAAPVAPRLDRALPGEFGIE